MVRTESRPVSFVYILASLLVGTFFVAAVYFADSAQSWGREGRRVFGFFYVYALALVAGFPMQIVAAILLRWITRVTRLDGFAHWVGFGAALGIAVPWTFAGLGYVLEGAYFPREWQSVKSGLMFPMMGAMMYVVQRAWLLAAVGGATGGTLRLMMRYFQRLRPLPRAR